jgi:hypothetical protein
MMTRPRRLPMPRAIAEAGDVVAVPRALLARIIERLGDHDARLGMLEREQAARTVRDAADERLFHAIDAAAEELPFKASHVLARAEQVPALAAALLEADIVRAQDLGCFLRRFHGVVLDDRRLERLKVHRGARLWQFVQVSTRHPCMAGD